MSVTDTWPPRRPGPASDRDNVTKQTLRAYVPHLPRNPVLRIGAWENTVQHSQGDRSSEINRPLEVNSVGTKAGRPFEKPAVVDGWCDANRQNGTSPAIAADILGT